jgi:hypothetical protein
MRKMTVVEIGAQLPGLALTVWLAASKAAPVPKAVFDNLELRTSKIPFLGY